MAGELRTATTNEQIDAIVRGASEITGRHLIIGGRSGAGFALAKVLASKGEGVFFTHSGARKPDAVEKALAAVRDAFAISPPELPGDPMTDVITLGGDVTTLEHQQQIVRATQLWLPEGRTLTSLTLAAARGTRQAKIGETAPEPDPEYAADLNIRGLLAIFKALHDNKAGDGRSLLHGATVLYPTSTVAHQWGAENAEQPEFYNDVGPSKWDAEQAFMREPVDQMEGIGGRVITAVMGVIDGTLVARGIKRVAPEYLERDDSKATQIDEARAGEGMADIIANPAYPTETTVHILPKTVTVEM